MMIDITRIITALCTPLVKKELWLGGIYLWFQHFSLNIEQCGVENGVLDEQLIPLHNETHTSITSFKPLMTQYLFQICLSLAEEVYITPKCLFNMCFNLWVESLLNNSWMRVRGQRETTHYKIKTNTRADPFIFQTN